MNDVRITYRQVIYALLFLIFQSSSFDVFLNLRLGGFSFRFVYIIILLLFGLFLLETVWKQQLRLRMLGLLPFLCWSLLLVVFVPNMPLIGRSVGYLLWLFIHFIFVVCCGYFINSETDVRHVILLYLISFLGCSFFGFIQLIAGLLGYDLLLEQWWIEGVLPRLNGFSYEPSYYSTYLILGFSLSYYLYRNGATQYGKLPFYTVVATFLAIFLSSSRMGILVAALQVLCFEVIRNRKRLKKLVGFMIGFGVIMGGLFMYILQNENLLFLFAGLGIGGESAHSSLERLDGFMTQIDILSRNPLKGYSLGGVSQAIAFEKGVTNISQETIKPYDVSMNIFLEVLTASGAIGFLFFMIYIYALLVKSRKETLAQKSRHPDSILVNALVWSLLFEFIILCFNQNILRAYLWVHIGLLSGVYFVIKRKVHQERTTALAPVSS